ncbi:autotransporter outer membrane beta-barrel domain-containing protein [Silvimonas iriomotensis]|uniref:Outer membrane autotransporter barrel domain-containing protein n=1 Tax=Silvimonas iriomotensis TaxID=449662 RepID=A0ABQ2P5P0_9NEIS|nr:autotransporter outer membrane beta-barrel domain-containing protein [Silvimonas iriomotensis]GGP18815.1 outer membrane autotransporter barrel domain-containing protein [Silvimonas iriomotensis]
MNRIFQRIWNAARNAWVVVSEHDRATAGNTTLGGTVDEAVKGLAAILGGAAIAVAAVDVEAAATWTLGEEDRVTILGGYKDQAKAGGADPDAKQVPENIVFDGGELNLTGGYYRATGRISVGEGGYGKITGGSSANLPFWLSAGSGLNTPPSKSGAMFLIYAPTMAGSQIVLAKDATLEIAFSYEGRNYVAVTNNGNYDKVYTPVAFGENAHIKLTGGTFRFDPYRHDRDVKLSNFIFNGGWLSTRGGDDLITADEDGQAIGKIEMGMGSDTFVIPENIHITALYVNGVPASEVRMYEFATATSGATDAGTGGLTGSMAEGSGSNPSDTVQINRGASSTDITYNFGYYNDVMTVADDATLIGGAVNMGNGPDTFTATAATLDGVTIKLEAGNDTLNLDGTTLQNRVAIDTGDGDDTANLSNMTLNPQVAATLQMGAGNDTANFSRVTLDGDQSARLLDMGAGNDVVNFSSLTMNGGGTAGLVDLGAGNDTANLTEVTINGNQGAASINFGAGNDKLNLTRSQINTARIDMATGASEVNILADAQGGVTQVSGNLAFVRSDASVNALTIKDQATLSLNEASVDFAGRVNVADGGTLQGNGSLTAKGGVDVYGTVQVGDGQHDGALSLQDAARITAHAGATLTGSGVLSSSGIELDGVVTAQVEGDRSLTYNDGLAGAGRLEKTGDGTLRLGGANTYSGGTQINAGTVTLTHQDAAGSGAINVNADTRLELDFAGKPGSYDAEFDNALAGAGVVAVQGTDIDITADNSGFTGVLQVEQDGSAQVRAAAHLGAASVALDGTLRVAPLAGGFAFSNGLTGQGTLEAQMGTTADHFDFTPDAGTGFTGTLAMGRGQFDLEGINTAALAQATLRMDEDSTTRVGAGEQKIGGLSFNGGTAVFADVVPDSTRAGSYVNAGRLDASGTGTVAVDLPDPYVPSVPGTTDTATLLEQDDGLIGLQLVQAAEVTGSGGALALTDHAGNLISAQQQVNIAQDGQVVAKGTYDFGLSTAPGDGLYVNYGLQEVDVQADQTLALMQAPGATGAAADLAARVTGSGHLAIQAGTAAISLSNARNDYRGETTVLSGTLRAVADHALGDTSALNLQTGTSADLNHTRQGIGTLNTQAGSVLDFNGGDLTVSNGGNALGSLTGAGHLRVTNPSGAAELVVHGANAGLRVQTHIDDDAAVIVDHVAGLGTGAIANDGMLQVASASAQGDLVNALSGRGTVSLTGGADVTLAADNSPFAGEFLVDNASSLTAASASHLGSAAVENDGTLNLVARADWTLQNPVAGAGVVNKEGNATLNVNQSQAWTGTTNVNAGALQLGRQGELASAQVNVAAGAVLGGYGRVAGAVDNQGTLNVGNASVANGEAGRFNIGGDLVNAGVVNLGSATSAPGNVLEIAGDYTGQDGQINFRTVLAGDDAATDKMIVHGDTAGSTRVTVKNANGAGELTSRGIELVQVDQQSGGEFVLQGRATAGLYEYRLYKGSEDPADGNWYLRSRKEGAEGAAQPRRAEGELVNDAPMTPEVLRPEPGAYLANQAMARGWQMHTLRDRVGESYFDNNQGASHGAWARIVGDHTNSKAGQGELSQSGNQFLLHAGADVARWDDDGQRTHLGVMGSVSQGKTEVSAKGNAAHAQGRVDGQAIGLYGTWFGDAEARKGPYVDAWLQHGWYKNKVDADARATQSYASRIWSASVEGGYEIPLRTHEDRQTMLTPQVQAVYSHARTNAVTDDSGTRIDGQDGGQVTTRVGVRMYRRATTDDGRNQAQPFVEANWLHGNQAGSVAFDGQVLNSDTPANLAEVKAGVEGRLDKDTTGWLQGHGQMGSDYSNYGAMVGVKKRW